VAGQLPSECTRPVFEIYAPKTDALACVEHQKCEIAHRKTRRAESDTFLIPKVVRGRYDHRLDASITVLTTRDFENVSNHAEDYFDPNGPL